MPRRGFFSFHYAKDSWRVSQVRNMGRIEGDRLLSDNEWQAVERGGEVATKNWIDDERDRGIMEGWPWPRWHSHP